MTNHCSSSPLLTSKHWDPKAQSLVFSSVSTYSLEDLIQLHGFKYHPHADDSQMSISSPVLHSELQTWVSNILLIIFTWLFNLHSNSHIFHWADFPTTPAAATTWPISVGSSSILPVILAPNSSLLGFILTPLFLSCRTSKPSGISTVCFFAI